MEDQSYSVGWICALPIELAASKSMFDDIHAEAYSRPSGDDNTYVKGEIGQHNVVMACLPAGEYGIRSCATTATHMIRSFPSLDFGFLVGIGGGCPSPRHKIKLGDIVVSQPTNDQGGFIQYDMGKTLVNGNFERRSYLNKPPSRVLKALSILKAKHEMEGSKLAEHVQSCYKTWPLMRHTYRKPTPEGDSSGMPVGIGVAEETPSIHYGLIASGNRVISNPEPSNQISESDDILCYEMEGAGLDGHPFLVIRGISDLADEKKDKNWQRYAALVAAAYAKELLITIPSSQPRRQPVYEADESGAASQFRAELVQSDSNLAAGATESTHVNLSAAFRVRNVSNTMYRYDLTELLSGLKKLSLSNEEARILSLAKSPRLYDALRTKIATVEVKRMPDILQ